MICSLFVQVFKEIFIYIFNSTIVDVESRLSQFQCVVSLKTTFSSFWFCSSRKNSEVKLMTVLLKLSQVWENCFIQDLNIVELADIYNVDFFFN